MKITPILLLLYVLYFKVKDMQKETIGITTEFITMDKLLKFSGVADTGGQAFMIIENGVVKLNGKAVSEKRKKVFPGDIVNIDNQIELVVVKENEA